LLCAATLTQHVDRAADWLLTVPTAMSGSRNRFPRNFLLRLLQCTYVVCQQICRVALYQVLLIPAISLGNFCTLAAIQNLTSFESR